MLNPATENVGKPPPPPSPPGGGGILSGTFMCGAYISHYPFSKMSTQFYRAQLMVILLCTTTNIGPQKKQGHTNSLYIKFVRVYELMDVITCKRV